MEQEQLKHIIESLLVVADAPLSDKQLKNIIDEHLEIDAIRDAVTELCNDYVTSDRSFTISEIAEGFLFSTLSQFSEWIKKLYKGKLTTRLSKPALETLSITAFKQPITRTDIEFIRRVDCGGVLSNLLDRKLIAISGRDKSPGKPLIYVTTQEFLRYFGLNRLSDLPRPKELEELLKERERQQTEMFDEEKQAAAAANGEAKSSSAKDETEVQGEDLSAPAVATEPSDGTNTPVDEISTESRPEVGDPGEERT